MATEETPEHEEQGSHGPAGAAPKGKGKGLLNGPHREMIIMVASVVGVGLAYATLKRSGSSGSSAAQTAAMGYPGSSATLSSGQVAGFDQAAVAGLQTQLANVSDQVRALNSTSVPSSYGAGAAPNVPIAKTLLAPLGTGNYVRYGNGTIAEIESDGSVYGISAGEPFDWSTKNITQLPWLNDTGGGPTYSDRIHNLAADGGRPLTPVAPAPAGGAVTASSTGS